MNPLSFRESLINTKNEALALISDANSRKELLELRIHFLGRKGKINRLSKGFVGLDETERKSIGILLNETKKSIEDTINSRLEATQKDSANAWLDVTQPGSKPRIGHLHPISLAIDEIARIFRSMGFDRVRYPEVDWDWYVFESLNMPPGHPARDEWETFFIKATKHKTLGEIVLTPHTSNGQVREMERVGKPPIRMLNISRNYRRQQDITHIAMLHQFEGLVVDKGINIQHLKGTIEYFAKKFYGPEIKIRLRPFNFSFTEPSFEVDFLCTLCKGKGKLANGKKCRLCKSGWHEVAGSGMVHPNVLKAGGIDPAKYTGFAFGMGVERAYMLKPKFLLNDVRLFLSTKFEFLEQF
jgi:phenylalanyl-tRNA synthetase alpha chain